MQNVRDEINQILSNIAFEYMSRHRGTLPSTPPFFYSTDFSILLSTFILICDIHSSKIYSCFV